MLMMTRRLSIAPKILPLELIPTFPTRAHAGAARGALEAARRAGPGSRPRVRHHQALTAEVNDGSCCLSLLA